MEKYMPILINQVTETQLGRSSEIPPSNPVPPPTHPPKAVNMNRLETVKCFLCSKLSKYICSCTDRFFGLVSLFINIAQKHTLHV